METLRRENVHFKECNSIRFQKLEFTLGPAGLEGEIASLKRDFNSERGHLQQRLDAVELGQPAPAEAAYADRPAGSYPPRDDAGCFELMQAVDGEHWALGNGQEYPNPASLFCPFNEDRQAPLSDSQFVVVMGGPGKRVGISTATQLDVGDTVGCTLKVCASHAAAVAFL